MPARRSAMAQAPEDEAALARRVIGAACARRPAAPPPLLPDLVALLWDARSTEDPLTRPLAEAVAAAAFGPQHLWQELGVSGRGDVTALLRRYFRPVADANVRGLKWKHHLFLCPGDRLQRPGLRPPRCDACDEQRLCFPDSTPGVVTLARSPDMKTSARNQFAGTITAIRHGAVNDEVELTLAGGQRIVAVLTRQSTQALGLREQGSAIALVKSSSVLLATDLDGMRLSARNQLPGTVAAVTPGAVNTEVVIAVDGGGSIAAIVTQASAQALGLAAGTRATAFFKASSVILAAQA